MSEPVVPEKRRFNHTGFGQYLAERHLMAARCTRCGEVHLPPRSLCPNCYEADMEWIELSGEGRLEGFTMIYVGLPAMSAYGYSRQNPYCSGVVRLREGPAITALILPANGAVLEDIRVGALLRAVFLEAMDGGAFPLAFETKLTTED